MNVVMQRLVALTAFAMANTVLAGNYDQRIDAMAKTLEPQVIEWRHQIHQNPELSNREFATAKLVAEHLRGLGFDQVISGIAPTGVVGILKGGKPGERVVALRADMDALPVHENADVPYKSTRIDNDYPGGPFPVAHACGHDTHVAMLMGAASVLAGMREGIPGTVMVISNRLRKGLHRANHLAQKPWLRLASSTT
jgi:metal-dependent amidase/aminoacylase/carboxypeptidase family protein